MPVQMNQGTDKDILIITGVSPVPLSEFKGMGIINEPIGLLLTLSGKNYYQSSIPSLGAAVMASYLRQQGIGVKIADYFFDEPPLPEADIIGISSTFLSLDDIKKIAEAARKSHPAAKIVLGGPASWSFSPEYILEAMPALDYIIIQEGERAFKALIGALRSGGDPLAVDNLVYRSDSGVRTNRTGPPMDMDELALPAWDLMSIPSPKRFPVLPVETGRGCPFNCAYCSEVTYWRKPVRYRRGGSVVQEILHNVNELGISTFRFADSCFSAPAERCAEVCYSIYENIILQSVPVKWSSYARIENLSRELMEKMRRSGCLALDIGLESGSPEVLRKMGRSYTPQAVVEVARTARDLDIITNFNVVVGFPGETEETVKETIEVINRAAPDTFTTFCFYLAPRTRAYMERNKYGTVGEGLTWEHGTMNSDQAKMAMVKMAAEVTESISLPAGEHIACYLTSVGYSPADIRGFFHAVVRMTRGAASEEEKALVTRINDSVSHLCYSD